MFEMRDGGTVGVGRVLYFYLTHGTPTQQKLTYDSYSSNRRYDVIIPNIRRVLGNFAVPHWGGTNNSNSMFTFGLNGTVVNGGSQIIGSGQAGGAHNLIASRAYTGRHIQGTIHEIVIFQRKLSSSERTQMNNYLMSKWYID